MELCLVEVQLHFLHLKLLLQLSDAFLLGLLLGDVRLLQRHNVLSDLLAHSDHQNQLQLLTDRQFIAGLLANEFEEFTGSICDFTQGVRHIAVGESAEEDEGPAGVGQIDDE